MGQNQSKHHPWKCYKAAGKPRKDSSCPALDVSLNSVHGKLFVHDFRTVRFSMRLR